MEPHHAAVVRLETDNLGRSIESLKQVWDNLILETAFSYYFLDDKLDHMYRSELKLGRFFTTFSFLAIIIAITGLFGISAYITRLKIREIGIRKVLGGTELSIILLFQKYFGKLVALAIVLAIPTVIFIMNSWLDGFAYRVTIGFTLVLLAAFLTLLITSLTVFIQSLRAVNSDPVIVLKAE